MDAILLVKASVLLSATLLTAYLLRRAPATTRHRLWSVVFAAMLALPLLVWIVPALDIPIPSGLAETSIAELRDLPPEGGSHELALKNPWLPPSGGSSTTEPQPPANEARVNRISLSTLLLAVWAIGGAAAVLVLALSLLRVHRLARTAGRIDEPEWQEAARALGARLGLRRCVRLLISPHVGTPMAGGVWRFAIFLPASAPSWSAGQRDVVLAHEIAHLASRDPLRHLLMRLALGLYWFHPLAWIAARQATVARERACDEAVLALGTKRSAYAQVLIELAESLHQRTPALATLPMVQPSLLENRIMAILNHEVRPVTRRLMLMPALGVSLLTVFLGGVRIVAAPEVPQRSDVRLRAGELDGASAGQVRLRAGDRDAAAADPAASVGVSNLPQVNSDRDSACSWRVENAMSFNGNISRSGTVIYEQMGTRGYDRIIQKSFGDLRLCMIAEDAGDRDDQGLPSQWIGRARRVVIEAWRGNRVQRMEIGRQGGGGAPVSWQVDRAARPLDDAVLQWRDRMLAVLDTSWELSMLRGQVSTLRGQISTIHGERSTLQGQISTLRGQVSTLQGRISTFQGEESTLRGQISTIQGHVSTLQGAISTEQGAISSLSASRYLADGGDRDRLAARIADHDAQIARIEREIRDYNADARIAVVQKQIDGLDTEGRVAAIEKEIRAFDLNGKVAAVERRIADLDVDGNVSRIEREIEKLDVDRRSRQLENRRDEELKRLEASVAAIR